MLPKHGAGRSSPEQYPIALPSLFCSSPAPWKRAVRQHSQAHDEFLSSWLFRVVPVQVSALSYQCFGEIFGAVFCSSGTAANAGLFLPPVSKPWFPRSLAKCNPFGAITPGCWGCSKQQMLHPNSSLVFQKGTRNFW